MAMTRHKAPRPDRSRRAGRRRSGVPFKIDADPELRAWIAAQVAGPMTLSEIAAGAREIFGPVRAPSRSAIGRWMVANGHGRGRGSTSRIDADPELRAWLALTVDRFPDLTYEQLAEAAAVLFGPGRAPSVSAIHRWAQATGRAGRRRRRRSAIDDDPELVAWLEEHAPRLTIPALEQAAIARFGPERAPSRSMIHRWELARGRSRVQGATPLAPAPG